MATHKAKVVSPYSAAMIGEHSLDLHAEAREKFREEAQVVSSYLKTLHPHRKQGHLQLNYPNTISRLNHNSSWTPVARSDSSQIVSSMNSSNPLPESKSETGFNSYISIVSIHISDVVTRLKEHMENMSRYTANETFVNSKKRLYNSLNGKKSVAHEVNI